MRPQAAPSRNVLARGVRVVREKSLIVSPVIEFSIPPEARPALRGNLPARL
jgi:hypothetical protein